MTAPKDAFPWREGVVPVEVDGELLVLDSASGRVVRLSGPAKAAVEGQRSVRPTGLPSDTPGVIDVLAGLGLTQERVSDADRRAVLRAGALAALGVSVLALPSATAHATGGEDGDPLAASGTVDTTFVPGDPDNGVYQIRIDGEGRILIGGAFNSVGGVSKTSGVARIHANGALDTTFQSGLNFSEDVYDLAIDDDGSILAVGLLNSASGRVGLVRLQPNGAIDPNTSVTPNIDNSFSTASNRLNDGSMEAVAIRPDGKIYVAGIFTTFGSTDGVGGTTRSSVARLHANGALDTDFADPGMGAWVREIAISGDNLVVAGGFTTVNGQTNVSNYLARLLPNGSRDTSFLNPNVNGDVMSLHVDEGGGILFGGQFTSVGGLPRSRVARVHANGAVDNSFVPPTIDSSGLYKEVIALHVQADGKVIIAGRFETVGGVTKDNIARLHANGALDNTFNASLNGYVGVLRIDGSGRVLAGGFFTNAGGTGQDYVTRIA